MSDCLYCGCEVTPGVPCSFCGRGQEPLPEAAVSAAWDTWVAATWHRKPNLQAVRAMLYDAVRAGLGSEAEDDR